MDSVQRLGAVLADRMKKTTTASSAAVIELGVINANLSLTVDSIPTPIPPSEYMISLGLSHKDYYSYNEMNSSRNAPHHHAGGTHSQDSGNGYHTHDDGLHDHRVPSVFRRLKSGDRVLVAWVGFEPIIIDIVVAGTTVTQN